MSVTEAAALYGVKLHFLKKLMYSKEDDEEAMAKGLSLTDLQKAKEMVNATKMSVKAATRKFQVTYKLLRRRVLAETDKNSKAKQKRLPKKKYIERKKDELRVNRTFPRIIVEKAISAVKVGGMSIEDSSENFKIPAEIIQNVLDSKLEIGDKLGPPPVPRKFKPGGKQYLKSKQPDRSKHWILDSLEEGSIEVTAAAALYGVSISALRRWDLC